MAVSLKHAFTSNVADSGDPNLVQPSNWNAEHALTAGADTLLGAISAGSVVEIPCTAAGRAILDDADAAAQRTTLGLGTGDSPQFTAVNIGNASDTTISRSAAGVIAVEGGVVPKENRANTFTENQRIDAGVGIGAASVTGTNLYITRNVSGSVFGTNIYVTSNFQSDVTAQGVTFFSGAGTAAASFTMGNLRHFYAGQGTFGAGSTVTNQTGFYAETNLVGATNNFGFVAANTAAVASGKTAYGFYSGINTATGGGTTWNFYAVGTAPNYFAGQVQLGAGAVGTPSLAAFGDTNTGMWFPAADTIAWSTGGSERVRLTSGGNLGIGTSTFGTSAATVLAIATGTAPSTGPADTIQIYSTDLSAGNTMLSIYTEGTTVNANTTAAATHRIAIRVNGTIYYLLANTAA